jgi:hypothetical protein
MVVEPKPGRTNARSMTKDPVRRNPKLVPTAVMTGRMALRKAWRKKSRAGGTPLATAVRMNSWPKVSIMLARVSRVRSAMGRAARITTGRMR